MDKQYITDAQTGEIIEDFDESEIRNQFLPPDNQPPRVRPQLQPVPAPRPGILDTPPVPAPVQPDTAVVRVNPTADAKVIALSEEILKINHYAQRAAVVDPATAKVVTNDISSIATLKKAIEEKRKEYKAPVLEIARKIDQAFEMLAAPLVEADKLLRQKLLGYNQELEKQRQAALEVQRLKDELAAREAEVARANGQEPPPPPAPVAVPDEQKRVRSDIGTVSFTWVVDKGKVECAIASGIREIPGIHIWLEPRWKLLNIAHVPEEYKQKTSRLTPRITREWEGR